MFDVTCTIEHDRKIYVGSMRERKVHFGFEPVRLQTLPKEILAADGSLAPVLDKAGAVIGEFFAELVPRRTPPPAEDAEA